MNPSTAPFLNSPPCFLNLCRSLCPNLCRICHPPLRPILPNPSFAASSTPTSISAPPKAPALSRNSPRAPTLPRTCASKPSKNSPTCPNPLPATAALASGAPSPPIALATRAVLHDAAADHILAEWLDKPSRAQVPKELQLDLLEAAAKRTAAAISQKLSAWQTALPKDDPLAEYRPCLFGGSAGLGKTI